MPINSANRAVISVAGGTTRTFSTRQGRKMGGSATIQRTDDATSGNLSVQFQNAVASFKALFDWDQTADGGAFKFTFDGEETASIAWNASAATVKAALNALTTINGVYDVEVVGSSAVNGYTVTLRPNKGTQPGAESIPYLKPLADDALTVTTDTVEDGGLDCVLTTTVLTWVDVDPDGYNAAIAVRPRGRATVSFGQGADENTSSNLLGPVWRVTGSGSGAEAQIELAVGDTMDLIAI
jgi:hypothetical protein